MKTNIIRRFIFGKRTLLFVLLCYSTSVFSQDVVSQESVDIRTYELYQKGEWSTLLKQGNKALDLGIDFFYLRMRMGYALYIQGKYRSAIYHYQHALLFAPNDIDAQALLMQCYAYSGRGNDALKFSSHISVKGLPQYVKSYHKVLLSTNVFYTYNTSESSSVQQQIVEGQQATEDGVQKVSNSFTLPQFGVSHRIGKSIVVNHQFAYLQKSEFVYGVHGDYIYTSYNQPLEQFGYDLKVAVTPVVGLQIIPSFYYIYASLPIYDDQGYGKGKEGTRQKVTTYANSYYFGSVLAQYDWRWLKAGVSYGIGNLNSMNQSQIGLHATIYPFSNLNLYYSFDGYHQYQTYQSINSQAQVQKHLLGFKVFSHLWMEATATFPVHSNFHDVSADVVYNGIEGVDKEYNVRAIVPMCNNHLSFVLNAGYYQAKTSFVLKTNPFDCQNTYTYTNYNLSGGLIWKL